MKLYSVPRRRLSQGRVRESVPICCRSETEQSGGSGADLAVPLQGGQVGGGPPAVPALAIGGPSRTAAGQGGGSCGCGGTCALGRDGGGVPGPPARSPSKRRR